MNLSYRKNDGSIKYNLSASDSTYINMDKSYYVFDEDILIGLFSLTNLYPNDLDLKYVILGEYRGRGYGNALVGELTDKIFENNPDKEKIKLMIDYNNIPSLRVAKNSGFLIDGMMYERMQESGEKADMIPYYKKNPYYNTDKIPVM